jgi:L-asparagine transporter-like permease
MINWGNLAANAVWIVGCAIALAALSYASYEAAESGEKFSVRLQQRGYQLALDLAGLLFCLGLAATSDNTLLAVAWLALAAAFLTMGVIRLLKKD